jgi:hypothetical protein
MCWEDNFRPIDNQHSQRQERWRDSAADRIADRQGLIDSVLRQQSASLHKATATFDSLLAQAFDPAASL